MAPAVSDLRSFLQPLRIDGETLYDLSYRLSVLYRKLAASPKDFFPTPITRLPTGQETGRYLAVYVGLSYLRVAFIDLVAGQRAARRTIEKAWPIEEHLRRDRASDLFSWIGDCVAEVVADSLANPHDVMPRELITGFSFCFPIKQNSVEEAILIPTGKGFALKSDLNLHQALLDGYERHTWCPGADHERNPGKRRKMFSLPRLKIAVMTNDTVAALASLAYGIRALPNTRAVMGLIVGAGSNATVPMKLTDLHESKTHHIRAKDPGAGSPLVSTEWTLANASGPLDELNLRTRWDKEVDANSGRPGFQPFETMIGGRYLGELVRRIACDWFHGVLGVPRSDLPHALVTEYALTTDFLSLTVAATRSDDLLAGALSLGLPVPPASKWQWTVDSARDLQTIARVVQERASALVAAATIGLLACTREIHLRRPGDSDPSPILDAVTETPTVLPDGGVGGPEELAVAVTGGVIQHYPRYQETIQRYIDQLLLRAGPQPGGRSVFLRDASDGGLIGTGVLAAGTATGEIGGIIGSAFDILPTRMPSYETGPFP
ncbi:hypothetical protein BDV25DRAFT_146564 [Aspergillus avenaceus]|uniref:Phosphotransferase n=1 Tax=Aspergillus avenaceus TaxID=36643 RepID=A0A5N6U903_ASPAV|nr:hypothetical protein BDV25DRAFT_146564 [Aspergillus avenaceus]